MMFKKNMEIGDLVWAKMKNFPYWPGKIVPPPQTKSSKKSRHYVYFFGSENHAWISEEHIMPHSEEMISSSKKKKPSLLFQNAIDAIVQASLQEKPESEQNSNGYIVSIHSPEKSTPKRKLSYEMDESNSSRLAFKIPKLDNVLPSLSPTATDRLHTVVTPPSDDSTPRFSTSSDSHSDPLIDIVTICNDWNKPVMPITKKIGFLGLGKIGQAIVKNLLDSGHHVFIWNRTSCVCDPFVKNGAIKCEFPKDVVAAADIILCCVSDCEAVKSIVFGVCGVLQGLTDSREGKGYVEMSSIDANTSQEIAEAITTEGGKYLEAPIVGNRKLAEKGKLTLLGAGDKTLFNECETCFHAISKNAYFVTCDVGHSSQFSLILSMLTGTICGALAEAFALAKSLNISHRELLNVLKLSGFSSSLIQTKGLAMQNRSFSANTPLKHQQKDMNLALCMSDEVEQPMPVSASANELYKRAKRLGYSDYDMASVYQGIRY